MAYTAGAAFEQFYSNINLSGDYRSAANARCEHVVSLLKKKLKIVDAFPTGSVPRFTATRGYADLDVLVALHYGEHIKDRTPRDVLQIVRDTLGEYRTNVRKNGQAVTMYYQTWPNVDIVPAARVTDSNRAESGYEIPDMNRGQWLKSDPKKHSLLIQERAGVCGTNFRRVITMVKWWNHKHSCALESYHIEAMAAQACTTAMTDITWDVFQFFDKAGQLARSNLYHLGGYADSYLDYNSRLGVVARLEKARDIARDGWYCTYGENSDHRAAIGRWRVLFGDEFPNYG